jgi:uncharacterized membrane protein
LTRALALAVVVGILIVVVARVLIIVVAFPDTWTKGGAAVLRLHMHARP